jgi:ferric-dicitrate binding protein FerR (iron transport regulator)
MGISSDLMNAPREFLSLFKAGQEAARNGNKQQAHDLFRRAIEIDPYHEQVWLWLASVVETDDDRRVCFENVLELNPANVTAQRKLQIMDQEALIVAMSPKGKRARWSRRRRWLVRLVLVALIAAAIVVAAVVTGLV